MVKYFSLSLYIYMYSNILLGCSGGLDAKGLTHWQPLSARKHCSSLLPELLCARKHCSSLLLELPCAQKHCWSLLEQPLCAQKHCSSLLQEPRCAQKHCSSLLQGCFTLKSIAQACFKIHGALKNTVQSHCSKNLGSVTLRSATLHSVVLHSVHGYARVHSS